MRSKIAEKKRAELSERNRGIHLLRSRMQFFNQMETTNVRSKMLLKIISFKNQSGSLLGMILY